MKDSSKKTQKTLSLQDTTVLKGLAICLMLVHHLFLVENGLFDDIQLSGNHYLLTEISKFAKICVTIFVFLSGYGLMIQTEKKGNIGSLRKFYYHRFKKLYFNYWFIWLVFVPISYFVFEMTFQNIYHSDVFLHLLLDLLGLHSLFFKEVYCFNPTWWFYSCIIVLYLFFPFFYKMMKRDSLSLLLMCFVLSFLPIPFMDIIQYYLFSFSLGMWMAYSRIAPPIAQSSSKYNFFILLILLILYVIVRPANRYPLMIDSFLTLVIVLMYFSVNLPKFLTKVLEFFGKHSMNIFLFHTFIFGFWFQDFIYWSRNPIIIFFTLLLVCIPISMLLELVKKYTIYQI